MIDIWVVEARLGGGGMGTVYRCHNRDATRIQAAIKVLDTRLADSGEVRRRFVREAELLFELDHPHIVKVRNIRMDAEPPFIEMAFVKGTSLRNWIHQGPMAPGAAARVIGQIASALNHCHTREVRHRDVKPDNILLSGSHATLVDFGIAAEANGTLTNGSGTVGTLSYTPPEWGDLDSDSRLWDTYSLGVVFYELLTGEIAFPARKGKSLRQEIVRIISQKQKIPWLDPGAGHPEELRALIRQLTATEPANRPTDLQEVADQLVRFTAGRDDLELEELVLEEESVTVEVSTAGSARDGGDGGGTERLSGGSSDTFAEYGLAPQGVDSSNRLSTVSEQPPARPAGVSWVRVGGVVAVLAAVGFGLLQWFFGGTPENVVAGSQPAGQFRPVEIVFKGDSHDLPVDIRVDGKPVDLDAPLTLPVAEHSLEARLGSGCAEASSSECLTTKRTVGVVAGVGPQRLRATLPTLRELTLQFDPALPEGAEVRIDNGDWMPPDGATVSGGIESTVTAKVGTCPGATCRQASIPVTPPLNPDGPVVASLELPPKRDRTAPQTAPAKAPQQAPQGHLVTVTELAAFLAKNPSYQREQIQDAPDGYLKDWSSAKPPPGSRPTDPATRISAGLAKALCDRRGGLYPLDGVPLRWDFASRDKEFRVHKKQIVLRRYDGVVVPLGDPYADQMTVIRCVR